MLFHIEIIISLQMAMTLKTPIQHAPPYKYFTKTIQCKTAFRHFRQNVTIY